MRKKQAVIIFSTAYLPLIGGAELAVKEITDRIDDLDFFLITARMQRSFARRERIGNAEVHRVGIGMPIFDKLFSPFLGAFVARKLMKKHDVMCFWSMMITYASGAPFLLKCFGLHKNIPILLTLQEGDSPQYIKHGRFGFINLSWRIALRFADQVQVISSYLADMARQYGYKGKISIVPNGANSKNFQTDSKSKISKQKTIITTSRLVHKNGVDILIDAIAKVRELIPDIQCWVLGDGEEKNNLALRVTRYALQDNVKFFGTIPYEKIAEYLAQADIFVRPSRSEGLGTAFLDAMAAGVPIIGTPVGGIPDFLKDGETGLFVRPDDADDLAGKIEHLMKDGALRVLLAENGRRLVEEHYDWNSIEDRVRALFNKRRALRLLIAAGIYPPDIGGPAIYSQAIAEEFSTRGIHVTVVTYADSSRHREESRAMARDDMAIHHGCFVDARNDVKRISRKWPKGVRHLLYFFAVLWHGRHADVIFAQQPVSEGLPAMIAARILRKKFILKIVGDYAWEQGMQRFGVNDLLDDFLQKKYGLRVEILRKFESFAVRQADCVIAVSNYLARVAVQWGVPRENIHVIPNAVELPPALPSKKEARRMLGISADAKIIVSAGRLVPWKGFAALIDCMTDIVRAESAAKLVIIGSGPDQLKLESRIINYQLGNDIQLMGSLSHKNVLLYLRAADVFALNTAYEGFSHLIIEAMAVGAPIVTTIAGGNAETVRDGENALVVPYNNREKIARAILRVLREDVVRATLAENGRKTATPFTKKRMIEETLNVLR